MEKEKYSVIVFDLGNVLLPFDYTRMLNRLNEVQCGLGEKFLQFYKENYSYHRSFEKGEFSKKEFVDVMINACGRLIDSQTFCRYYSEIFTPDDQVISLLPKLKENYKLVLLSNTNSIHREFGYNHYEFLKYFDKMILSYEVKALKPEPEIFKAVEHFTNAEPSEHIFIDDIYEYANAAKFMGWDAIQFVNYEQLISEFKKRGIKVGVVE